MADRSQYYFRQRVTEDELNLGFDQLEQADRAAIADLGRSGILSGAVASQTSPAASMSVAVSAGVGYDEEGQRIFFGANQTIDCSVDLTGALTAVTTVGEERYVSVLVRFARTLSDPRTDGSLQTVYFLRSESVEFVVRQGAQAPSGTATRADVPAGELLICDVLLTYGATQIVNGDLLTDRRSEFLFAAGEKLVPGAAGTVLAGGTRNSWTDSPTLRQLAATLCIAVGALGAIATAGDVRLDATPSIAYSTANLNLIGADAAELNVGNETVPLARMRGGASAVLAVGASDRVRVEGDKVSFLFGTGGPVLGDGYVSVGAGAPVTGSFNWGAGGSLRVAGSSQTVTIVEQVTHTTTGDVYFGPSAAIGGSGNNTYLRAMTGNVIVQKDGTDRVVVTDSEVQLFLNAVTGNRSVTFGNSFVAIGASYATTGNLRFGSSAINCKVVGASGDTELWYYSGSGGTGNVGFGPSQSMGGTTNDTLFRAYGGSHKFYKNGTLLLTLSGDAIFASQTNVQIVDGYLTRGVTPATTGDIRLAWHDDIYMRNADNSDNVGILTHALATGTLYVGHNVLPLTGGSGATVVRAPTEVQLSINNVATVVHTDSKFELRRPIVLGSKTELTIASGGVTVSRGYHVIDTEGDASTDDLDTISGGVDGQVLVLRAANFTRDVVLTTVGNIAFSGGTRLSLIDGKSIVTLLYSSGESKWILLAHFGCTLV